jgi:flagellar hook-associated protein 2
MATTALSSSTASALANSASTSAATAATNSANAQKLITSLGAGSGVDVASLAQNLVDAERLPQENAINTKITKNEARISGYAALSFVLNNVKTALTDLKDQSSFNAVSVTNSNSSAFSIATNSSAAEGSHSVEVLQVAKAQRDVSNGLSDPAMHLNGNAAMSLSFSMGPTSAITPSKLNTPTVLPTNESSVVTFQGLLTGESVTVAGLTFIASEDTTAADVAAAFAGLSEDPNNTPTSPSNGVFVGNLAGFNASANASNGSLTFSSTTTGTNVTDIDLSTDAAVAPTAVTTQGNPISLGSSAITFKDLIAGQSVTVAGLTFTASAATTAAQVASAFGGLSASNTTPSNPSTGTFSGSLVGFNAEASQGSATLRFTVASALTDVNTMSVSAATANIQLAAGKDTPQDIVDAINASSSGITAQLVNTGDGSGSPYQLMLTGPLGSAGAFSLNTSYGAGGGSPGLTFSGTNQARQTAADAIVKVDGVAYTRSSNSLSDVVTGLTINIKTPTPISTPASVDLTRDTSAIKTKIQALVTAYNDAITIFKDVSDPKSTLETYGKTLLGDSTARTLKAQLRSMIVSPSSTPGKSIDSLAQMGLSIDQTGVMTLDATKLDSVLASNYTDVVKAFTGNQNGVSAYTVTSAGIAGDAFKKLSSILSKTGPLLSQSESATTQNTKYQADLTKLQTRMDALLLRYKKQFSSMDSLVGSINSQKTSLKSTFDGMMASLTGKSG